MNHKDRKGMEEGRMLTGVFTEYSTMKKYN